MRKALVAALLLGLLVAACGSTGTTLEGVIVDIDSSGLNDINSFTLKDGGDTYEISIDPDIDYDYRLGHLQEHVQSSEPIRVETEERDGKLIALSIEDI